MFEATRRNDEKELVVGLKTSQSCQMGLLLVNTSLIYERSNRWFKVLPEGRRSLSKERTSSLYVRSRATLDSDLADVLQYWCCKYGSGMGDVTPSAELAFSRVLSFLTISEGPLRSGSCFINFSTDTSKRS